MLIKTVFCQFDFQGNDAGDRRLMAVDQARRDGMASAIERNPDLPRDWYTAAGRLGGGQVAPRRPAAQAAAPPPVPQVRLLCRLSLRLTRLETNKLRLAHRLIARWYGTHTCILMGRKRVNASAFSASKI